MKDRFGRTIDYMRISITDRCNLRCRYCMPAESPVFSAEDVLSYEELEAVCTAAAQLGIRRLKITGGEPLVRPGCAGFIGRLKQVPGIEQVTLTTNGVLLGEYLPELLENGLDAVNISLDSLKRKTYRLITGRDELAAVRMNMKRAVKTGIRVKINAVLQQGVNDGEWRDLAELTKLFPVDVRFIEMMPIGYGKKYRPIYQEHLLEKFREAYPGFYRDKKIHGNGPAVYYQIPGAKGGVGFISALHGKFCAGCNRLRLSADGKLKPCLCFGDEVDLGGAVRLTDQKVRETRLREAFQKAVRLKPQGHQFEDVRCITETKQMVQIGG